MNASQVKEVHLSKQVERCLLHRVLVNVWPMKDYCKMVSMVSLVLALGLSITLFGGTAHAADTAKTTQKIAGEHLTFLTGFIGATPSTA